jgi:hypothetical protein
MLQVVGPACVFSQDKNTGSIAVQSDRTGPPFQAAFDELNEISARQLALKYASEQGVAGARQNGNVVGPYPVNGEGLPLDLVRDEQGRPLPQTHPRMQPVVYRIEVPVVSPIR